MQPAGDMGNMGDAGNIGDMGFTGNMGKMGDTSQMGDAGNMGDTGEMGDTDDASYYYNPYICAVFEIKVLKLCARGPVRPIALEI